MKKRIVVTLLTTLLTAATMTGCGNNYTVALTDTNPVKVELGTELSTDVRDYITVTDKETTIDNGEVFEDITLDTTNVDVNAVGTYIVVITYEKSQLVIPVIVEDTTAPTIEAEDVALAEGTEVTVAEYVKVTDAQEVEVMFILADGTKTDKFTYDGTETEVTVVAEDAEGNVAEKAMKITLLDTTAPATPTPAPTPSTPTTPTTPTTPDIPQHVDDIVIGEDVQDVINSGGTLGDIYDSVDWNDYDIAY